MLALISYTATTILVLGGNDPIELTKGNEILGRAEISVDHLRYRYQFKSTENRELFLRNRDRYSVAMGGACGRMGALSGRGAPTRWAVVEGKIYLFASEQCRSVFLKDVKRFIPKDKLQTRRPTSTEAITVLRRIQAAHRIEGVQPGTAIEWTQVIPYQQQGKSKLWFTRFTYLGPSSFISWEEWDQGRSFMAKTKSRFMEGSASESFPMDHIESRALGFLFARHPVGVLTELAKPVRSVPGKLTMAFGGTEFDVFYDRKSYLIEGTEFTGPFNGLIQNVETRYTQYRHIGIWRIPIESQVKLDGGSWSKPLRHEFESLSGSSAIFKDIQNKG
jgi:hypothetical protein